MQYLTTSFILDLQENIYNKVKKIVYMSAGFAGRHVMGFEDLSIDVFLEVQNTKYSLILYLMDYIAYGLHLWYTITIFKEICRKAMSLHPGLATSLAGNRVYKSATMGARRILYIYVREHTLALILDFGGPAFSHQSLLRDVQRSDEFLG